MTLLALAVGGRGLVDPPSPSSTPTTRPSCAGGRRSRRSASTAGGRFGSTTTSSGSPAPRSGSACPAVDVGRLPRHRARGSGRLRRAGRRPAPLHGPPAARAAGSRPRSPWSRRSRATSSFAARAGVRLDRHPARHRTGRARGRALAARRRQVDELRGQHGRRGRGAAARRRRRRLPRGRRHRARGPGHERLVAHGPRPLHARARARDPRRRHARDPRRGRRRARLHRCTRAATRSTSWPAAEEAFTSSSVREVMPAIELDGKPVGDGRPGPAAAELQAALRGAAAA